MAGTDLTRMTAAVVKSYVTHNEVAMIDLGALIADVHAALSMADRPPIDTGEQFIPAVSVRKSLSDPARIMSMIDGKPYAMLRHHLALHGLTPSEYRERYNLPADYPMTAPAYSERRRSLALASGFGRGPKIKRPTGHVR